MGSKKTQTKTVTKLKQSVEQFKFTDRKLKSLKNRLKSYKVRDTECPKLYLVINRKSKKFVSYYKIKNLRNPTSTTHGDYGDITISAARNLHNQAMELAVQGFNPNESLLAEKTPTIHDCVLEYIEINSQLSPRTEQLYRGLHKKHLDKRIFHVPFSKLNETKFVSWHKSYGVKDKTTGRDKSQIMINCLKLLSATFNAQPPNLKKDAENPKKIINRRRAGYKQNSRSHQYLNFDTTHDEEAEITRFLRYLWEVTYGHYEPVNEEEDYFVKPTQDQVYIDSILLMLLTGLRVDAVISLKWTQVDFDKDVLIALEKGRHGEKKPRVVPLTKYTYRLLRWRQQNNKYRSKWIFPSRPMFGKDPKGKTHIRNPVHIWKKLRRRAKVFGDEELINKVTRHGLRRTISRLAKHLGYNDEEQRAVLDQSTTSVMAKHYNGQGLVHDRLRDIYDECHTFIDNRLVISSGSLIPLFKGEEDMDIEGLKSPLMSMWGKNDIPLEADRYLTSFDESGYKESKSRFSEYD